MMFDSTHIPETHFDWKDSLKLMGNKESITRELAKMLRDTLPEFKLQLQTAFEQNDKQAIQSVAHKLHGGLCYVSTPRLKYLISNLEIACKQHPDEIDDIAKFIAPSIDLLHKTLTQTV